jgi:S-adenosylmethionine:tRNA ribosyltransferase-isomerase
MPDIPPDFCLRSYAFDLPAELIAQEPASERAASRLMVLDRRKGGLKIASFGDILDFLPEKALLVANNSRVVPARLRGVRPGGGKAEMLLLTPLPLLEPQAAGNGLSPGWRKARAEMLLRPAKKLRPGDLISAADDLAVELIERGPFGRCRVFLLWRGDLPAILRRRGVVPLPPYIKRPDDEQALQRRERDLRRYQTVYAREDKAGSVAAPTAGLHFTPEILDALRASGRQWAEATLYVGYGTFSPVREEDIREHAMHAEYVELPEETAEAVNRARAGGRAVIAVGTTAARILEGAFAARQAGESPKSAAPWPGLQPFSGWTDVFLYPGKSPQVADGLITNFHLPGSSLLMLVSALAGRERTLAAYRRAVAEKFRFFSYGDAMLVV